jgi:hypothetical protein
MVMRPEGALVWPPTIMPYMSEWVECVERGYLAAQQVLCQGAETQQHGPHFVFMLQLYTKLSPVARHLILASPGPTCQVLPAEVVVPVVFIACLLSLGGSERSVGGLYGLHTGSA